MPTCPWGQLLTWRTGACHCLQEPGDVETLCVFPPAFTLTWGVCVCVQVCAPISLFTGETLPCFDHFGKLVSFWSALPLWEGVIG